MKIKLTLKQFHKVMHLLTTGQNDRVEIIGGVL
ncbi:hypothetical protein VPHPS15B6_0071 [Vibrio phage PS15B-6]